MKAILRIAVFGAGIVVFLGIMSAVFNEGVLYSHRCVMDYDDRTAGLQQEPRGQIDVLFVGDSLCGADIIPLELYRDHGITSYNMGKNVQKSVETYYSIREALKTQPIKVVVWEAHNLTKRYENTDPWSYGLAEFIRYRLPYVKYHSFWKLLIDGRKSRKYFKGYMVSESVVPYTKKVPYYDPNDVDESWKIQYDQEYMLTKVQKLCEENGIKLVLFSAPSPKCYKYHMHAGLAKTFEEHGLDYLDANCDLDKIKIDWERDFYDRGDHLNLFGARKVTQYLAQYLEDNCDLTDHRGDPEYRSWDDLLPEYDREVIDMEGTSYLIIEKESGQARENLVLTPLDKDKYEEQEKKERRRKEQEAAAKPEEKPETRPETKPKKNPQK